MKKVIIESPYAGDVEENMKYLQRCIKDSLEYGEAPFASHLMYTEALDDTKPEDRNLGIQAGFNWGYAAHYIVVYGDLGISKGMEKAIKYYSQLGKEIRYRSLYDVRVTK